MNRLEVVQQLLGHKGINVNLQSVDTHSTALHEAASYGHTAIAEALLAAPGIEVNPELRTDAATPLLVAARKGSVGVVAALLKAHGINVTAVRSTFCRLANTLRYCCSSRKDVLRILPLLLNMVCQIFMSTLLLYCKISYGCGLVFSLGIILSIFSSDSSRIPSKGRPKTTMMSKAIHC
jgi:hypothetical protein